MGNSNGQLVLWLILAVLLFGSGAVLGFFSALFWIIVVIAIIIGIIWFLAQTPKVAIEIVEEQKAAYRKHPVGVIISFIILGVLIIFWLASTQGNHSAEVSNTGTLMQYQQTNQQPTIKKIDYQSMKGYTFPEINRSAFKQNCVKEAGSELAAISQSYCSCLLKYFELNYSFKEFLGIEQQYIKTGKFPPDVTIAINRCVGK